MKTLRFGKCNTEDRLSALPDELITQILSLLPTKDAAAASLSSRNMRSSFTRLTALDFDDFPISYCPKKRPVFVERFPLFKTFVSNVLQASKSPHLSSFKIGFGGNLDISQFHFYNLSRGCPACFPAVDSTLLNAWIGFPLNRNGLREIDLRIHVRIPGKLPSALFACQTLEVLKLDTNLDLELVSSMSSFWLPNLKVLQLYSILILDDGFVSRLLSGTPSLEELHMNCWWKPGNSVTISSPSLRKLTLFLNRHHDEYRDLTRIDTPNLQRFKYGDNIALHYSIPSMKALVEASIHVSECCLPDPFESMLSLVIAVSNVERLNLAVSCLEVLGSSEEMINQVPVFDNLRLLKLGHDGACKWDRVLLECLTRSPLLETLGFPRGFILGPSCIDDGEVDIEAESERLFFRKNHEPPPCCKSCLKRIYIKDCWASDREVELIRFLLKMALVLEELLIICKDRVDSGNKTSFESTVKKLPKASSNCVITIQ